MTNDDKAFGRNRFCQSVKYNETTGVKCQEWPFSKSKQYYAEASILLLLRTKEIGIHYLAAERFSELDLV